MSEKHIAVWHDETSDDTAWIVSVEDAAGSQTIASYDHDENGDDAQELAIARGRRVAAKRCLPLRIEN